MEYLDLNPVQFEKWLIEDNSREKELEKIFFHYSGREILCASLIKKAHDTSPCFHLLLINDHLGGFARIYQSYLSLFIIHPIYRRRGYGRSFLQHLLSLSKYPLYLEVREDNPIAQKLYYQEGFKRVGEKIRDHIKVFILRKDREYEK